MCNFISNIQLKIMAAKNEEITPMMSKILSLTLDEVNALPQKVTNKLNANESEWLVKHVAHLESEEKQLSIDKKEFVSTLKDFIVQMAKAYPLNTELSLNQSRLCAAGTGANDEIVDAAGAFLITYAADIINYDETGDYNKLFESDLFDYSEEALVRNTELLDDKRIAKYLMELFASMKNDLLAKDVKVADLNNLNTTISIRKQAADYISELTALYGSIGARTGAFDETED